MTDPTTSEATDTTKVLQDLRRENRALRRLLAQRSGLHLYQDDGEAQGCYKSISVDFLTEPASVIRDKLYRVDLMRFNDRYTISEMEDMKNRITEMFNSNSTLITPTKTPA